MLVGLIKQALKCRLKQNVSGFQKTAVGVKELNRVCFIIATHDAA